MTAPASGRRAPLRLDRRARGRLPPLETRRTLAALPLIAWCGEADGSIGWTNPAWQAAFGPTDATCRHLAELVHPDDLARLSGELFAGGGSNGIELRLRQLDGRYRRYRVTLSPLPSGGPLGWLGTAVEVPVNPIAIDARAALEAQRAAGVLLGFVLESGPIGFAFFDHDGRYRLVNTTLAHKHLRRVEDYPGRLPREVVPEHAERLEEGFAAVWSTGVPIENSQVRTRDADGAERRWLESLYRVAGEAGEPIGVGVIVVDVTELEHVREEREATLERYAGLELAIPQLVWTADAKGAIDYVNPRWIDYTGLALEAIAAGGWWAAAEPEDRERIATAWRRAVRDGAEVELECRLMDRHGAARWFLVRAVPFHEGGAMGGYVGTCTDVDAQKSVQTVLRASEARLQLLAEASRILGESLDERRSLDGLANLIVPGLADWCLIELAGPAGPELATLAHADPGLVAKGRRVYRGRSTRGDRLRPAQRVLAGGRSELVPRLTDEAIQAAARGPEELASLRSLGLRSAICVPLMGRNGPLGAITLATAESSRSFDGADLAIAEELGRRAGVAIELARLYREQVDAENRAARLAVDTRLRAAELQAAIRGMDEALVVLGPDGRVRLMNAAGQRLFAPPRPTSAPDIGRAFVGRDGEPFDLEMGAEIGPVELRLARDDGRALELRAFPIRYGGGEAEHDGQIVVVRDVTEWRQREAASEAFLSVLSHELRTPITTIYGSSRLLANMERELAADERRTVLRDVEEEASRLARLVDDMLVLARIREERVVIADEPLLVHRMLPRIVAAERGYQPGVDIRLRVADEIPPVRGDETYLEQVVRNLLGNAAKYAPIGSRVEVVAEPSDGGATVRVLDRGPGYPPDEGDKLFELYYRSGATAGRAGGAGVGLFVCHWLVQAMGGRIWTALRPGGGAEFGFWLPGYEEPEA